MKQYTKIFITIAVALLFPAIALAQWVGPTATPPSNNTATPLDVSATAESKIGGLLLNTGGAANGLIVQNGNVGICTTNPFTKLDIAGKNNPYDNNTTQVAFEWEGSGGGYR